MVSLQNKIKAVSGLADTRDVSEWENGFIKNLDRVLEASKGQVLSLSDKQIYILDELYDKHFAG